MFRWPWSSKRKFEALSADHGYYYTIRRCLLRAKTDYQKIELAETDRYGKVLLIDGITQLFEKTEFQYHEALVHPALCAHPDPRSVLIIGGGDGGVLREVCRHRCVERIDMVELDAGVIELARARLSSVHGGAFDDPRLRLQIGDGRAFVESKRRAYDAILMDMTDPSGPSCRLYTVEFYAAVRRALRNASAIFSMHAESAEDRPVACTAIVSTNRRVFRHVRPMFGFVAQYGTLWAFLHSSMGVDVARTSAATIDRRLRDRAVQGLRLYNGAVHQAMCVSRPYIDAILKDTQAPIITDAAPDFPDAFE